MRQQLVQTDLTYQPRAPSPITEEDYTLLRHAKEIVETRAEEFSRYSQIIEKSEYDRLAETVKKVEKRMRVSSILFLYTILYEYVMYHSYLLRILKNKQ